MISSEYGYCWHLADWIYVFRCSIKTSICASAKRFGDRNICFSLKENRCLLGLFIGSLVVLLACMIGGLWLVVTGDGIEAVEYLRCELEDSIAEYDPDAEAGSRPQEITAAWDQVQREYSCCGINNDTDWINLNENFEPGTEVP